MPKVDVTQRFHRDYATLTDDEKATFREAVQKFVSDLQAGMPPRSSLRIRQLATAPGVYEFTWDADGRATFEYKTTERGPSAHVVWRRIGGHEIFANNP